MKGLLSSERVVQVSQGWTKQPLALKVDTHKPKAGDKQAHEWYDADIIKEYKMPPCSIQDPDSASKSIEVFLLDHIDEYIDSGLQGATTLARRQFEMARSNRNVRRKLVPGLKNQDLQSSRSLSCMIACNYG